MERNMGKVNTKAEEIKIQIGLLKTRLAATQKKERDALKRARTSALVEAAKAAGLLEVLPEAITEKMRLAFAKVEQPPGKTEPAIHALAGGRNGQI